MHLSASDHIALSKHLNKVFCMLFVWMFQRVSRLRVALFRVWTHQGSLRASLLLPHLERSLPPHLLLMNRHWFPWRLPSASRSTSQLQTCYWLSLMPAHWLL